VRLPSQVCNQHVIHPTDAKKAQAHRDDCRALVAKLARRVRDSSIECGICLEKVMTKAEMSQRRFGLMACEHPFCLGCIRNWRSTGEVNAKTVSCNCS
jgi:E3 ubiquitin-protein ligase makorin